MIPRRLHERLIEKKKRLDSHRPLPRGLVEKIRARLVVEYTHSSNAIEGNTLSLGETRVVLEDGVTIGGKSLREHLEARNHPAALSFVEELADADREIGERDILRLHSLVMRDVSADAGGYRSGMVAVAGATFQAPPSREVPERIRELLHWLKTNPEELTPVELGAEFMHGFTVIHPFTDGNGRVARLLLNLILIRGGYPFVTNISYVDRLRYLRSLSEADLGNPKPLGRLVALSVERALDAYLDAVEEPENLTLGEASRRSGESVEYLGLLARTGRISASKRGGRWVVTEEALEYYLSNRQRGRPRD